MKLLIAASLFVSGSCLLAQTSATGFGRQINPSGIPSGNWGAGFGRMIYPGTGGPPAAVRPGTPGAPAGRGGGRGRVVVPPPIAHQGHANGAIVAYPVYYGGYYYPYDAPAAPQQGYGYGPNYDPGYDPNNGGQPSPVVIINQNFKPDVINPVVTDYSNTQLPQYIPAPQAPAPQPTVSGGDNTPSLIFLIAMKDHTIYPAVAYWVEDDTLNYLTAQGVRNRISLGLVDREFSKQLNKERNVDFGLPDPPPAAK
jgi:hypothetical protein